MLFDLCQREEEEEEEEEKIWLSISLWKELKNWLTKWPFTATFDDQHK